jgi:hypothetical protein
MKRSAGQGAPNFIAKPSKNTTASQQKAQSEIAEIQARRIARLYAVSFVSAVTIARLAYAVGAP